MKIKLPFKYENKTSKVTSKKISVRANMSHFRLNTHHSEDMLPMTHTFFAVFLFVVKF